MTTRRDLTPGTELLGYRIDRVIGRGGMGVVYLAHQLILDRRAALKLLLPELADDETFRERFLRESRLAASLEHPSIVPLYDAGQVDGLLYLAMRYVDGGDLGSLIAREAPFAPARAVALLSQVAGALDAAHARGLVHRDVKPGNILVEGENAYLSDFGLALSVTEPGRLDGSHHLASAAYVAPEQIERRPVGSAADVYSLGCVLYECLSGAPPFQDDTLAGVLFAHLELEPAPVSSRNPGLPTALDTVLQAALAKDPTSRPQSCSALISDTRAALGLQARRRPRARVVTAVAAVLVVGVVLGGATRVIGGSSEGPSRTPIENSVVRLDPRTGEIAAVVPVGQKPTSVAVGEGTVWVINQRDGTVSEIDGRSNAVRRTVRLTGNVPEVGLTTIAADGAAAWVAARVGSRTSLMRIDEQTGEFPVEIPVGKVDPIALAVGEGHVWLLAKDLGGNLVVKIDTEAEEVVGRARVAVGEFVTEIAVGEGSIWFTDWQREETLSRLDPKTMKVTGRVDVSGDDALAVGAGGVWLADIEAGTLTRVDPKTLEVAKRIELFEPPFLASVDVTADDEHVWVSYLEGRTVYQVDPRSNTVVGETTFELPGAELPFPPGPKGISTGSEGVWVAIGSQT
jgi:streptogramin lyase/tRNA A-37 threonylcarbamoyl transferase component Bud32